MVVICFSLSEKKQEMLIRGRKGCELDVRFGFVVENNIAALELVSSLGLQVHDSEYNALGYNRMGVYLCKHSDVCLRHALVKYSGSPVLRMVISKVGIVIIIIIIMIMTTMCSLYLCPNKRRSYF